jgi:hypothetical protein
MPVAHVMQLLRAKQATPKPSKAADDDRKELDMNDVIDFAGVAGAIGLSVALALWLEWVTLRGLMRLMPARAVEMKATPISTAPAPSKDDQAKAA